MSRTRRKRWVPNPDSEDFELILLEHQREKTCKPGCAICSKGWVRKAMNRKERYTQERDIEDFE